MNPTVISYAPRPRICEKALTVYAAWYISQIIDADVIYTLKEGRVAEYGAHEDIYRQNGTYREIFDASARSLETVLNFIKL